VIVVEITLHIGLGTFKPVSVSDTKDHKMHYETYEISEEAAATINKAIEEKRRIISVGTTATRTLEANFNKYQKIVATSEATNLFITPGYKFKVISALITNFHLPKSTLIMLVSAFAGRENTLAAYCHAIKERYRFFSFGDVMYIYGED
jgi:S-adenosylmethionine:tRNA ribosyltransferase-isomerase